MRTFSNESNINQHKSVENFDDKRIILTKLFVAVIFLSSMLGVFLADNVTSDGFLAVTLFAILLLSNYLGFVLLRKDIPVLLIFSLFCVYVWLAFPFKLMLALYDPMTLWVSHSFFAPQEVSKEIAGAFIALFPGLLFLFVGFYIINFKFSPRKQYSILKIQHIKFISIIVSLMILRVLIQLFLDIGVPGLKPKPIPIPFAVGTLELLTRPVLLALVNVYFYYVIRFNDKKWIKVALLLCLINIALGLRVGYKSELVLQVLLLMYYLFEVFPYISKANKRFMSVFTASLLVAMIVLYPLVNHYRSYLLSGKDISEAVESAQVRTEKETSNVALSFLNRINGIGAFYAAKKLGEGEEYTISALFNDDVMDLIKYKLYGSAKDKAVTAFGTTQFSVFYLIGGGLFLSVCCLLIGIIIRYTSSFIQIILFKSKYTFNAYLPLLCILWVKLLSSGGNLMLYIKELVLVIVCLMLIERFTLTTSQSKET
ncbi:MAG: hypothetical protein QM500_16950 [Methylococcales bacterium]